MQIWMDGDACPKPIKDILFRAATRSMTLLQVVSNHTLITPGSKFINRTQVSQGFDVADQYIVDHMQPGDLVITADIPLADSVVTNSGYALNPRGEFYTSNNIKQHLMQRNMNESLRGSGLLSGGPPKFSLKDLQRFANHLDQWITKQKRAGL